MRPNVMLSRSQLLEFSQGRELSAFDRTIDNQVSRLRRKLERDIRRPRYIKTVWGGGYAFISSIVQP
jgi:two-component system OmpR family response regulator